MLYQFNEFQRMVLSPLRMAAQMQSQVLRSPFNPMAETPQAQTLAAAYELFAETTQYHGKPAFGISQVEVDGRTVAVTEENLSRKCFGQLKHFKRDTTRKDPKLLIVAPMSGHFATLLRGTVETMIKNHDVYITDWRDASNVPLIDGRFDLDDYIDYVQEFLEFLGPNTHVMAVCQPGVPVLAATALMAEEDNPNIPATVTLMGSPIDTRRHPTAPCKLAMDHSLDWFEKTVINHVPIGYPGAFRRVYPGFLQLSGFMSMNLDRHMEAHARQFDHLVQGDGDSADKHRAFYSEYNAVMDLTAEYYLQTIETVFQKQALAKGEMMYRGDRLVDTSAISNTALMTVEGELDDISGIGQTVAAHDICNNIPESKKAHYEQKGVGHYGVFNGRRFNSEIAPRISDFILKHEMGTAAPLYLVQKDTEQAGNVKLAPKKVAKKAPPAPKKAPIAKKAAPKKEAPVLKTVKSVSPAVKKVAKSALPAPKKAAMAKKAAPKKEAAVLETVKPAPPAVQKASVEKPVAVAPKTAKVEAHKTVAVHKNPAKAPAKKKA
ncbi:MAG: polyhydroxyalkanoate depolymerase [Sneathiella sp.]|uniref:polyhydroxyalkanoate depolymerase n=1 Tax=Sneathiella sp. TaxID=1964365 RepID=UPI003002544B